ncbi:MAG: hypothetical protein GTO45_10665 [Candidatus Aminicenantes bacterium]|nr:hypothetical protein [Candidatus Aminicenantes bacterium]NIM79269.1 hypothetical protein [Candidatus Aminicenantes bacterium]NIN18555.1 hypothetical protein [Candidatus Aminicenantes bacterium]NIN42452.1 hypothetical protein [Candidatus Aminicenantes bacterium]NIN85210.1 hypothetical protein [Candidatus Aminicenantes bacterium]
MKHQIHNIKNIPEVVGVAVFKDDGSLVAFDFPEGYDRSLLDLMGLRFQPIKEILPEDEAEIVYLCWEFENLLGFYYPVKGGWVNIISSDQIPMPVFSLTMTAVANKLPELLEQAEPLQVREAPENVLVEYTVPPKTIEELEKLLALYLGPASTVIFKRVAMQLGFTLENIPPESLKSLLDGVIARVPDDKKAEVSEKVKKYY